MEFLIAALVTLNTEVFKWFMERFGFEKTKAWTLVLAFFLSVGGMFAWKGYMGMLDFQNVEDLVSVFGLAVGYYEIFIKNILKPIFNKFSNDTPE